jgi:hypothetical protein
MLLGEILYDMRPFLGLMGAVVLINSFAFKLLAPHSDEFGTFSASWFSACAHGLDAHAARYAHHARPPTQVLVTAWPSLQHTTPVDEHGRPSVHLPLPSILRMPYPCAATCHRYALMLGDIPRETVYSSHMMIFFFHYYTIFVDIVLLNTLIAIISDTCAARRCRQAATGP